MNPQRIRVGQLILSHPLQDFLNASCHGEGAIPVRFEPLKKNEGNPNEGSFRLTIEPAGIAIAGHQENALSTLLSLIEGDEKQTYLPLGSFQKTPAFPYRGVLLDEARHYQGKENVKALLDAMFRLHLNVFHWHLSDDQGFRLALSHHLRLVSASTREGTLEGFLWGKKHWVNGPYAYAYSEDEVHEILAYAHARGIEVIPEIDIPGHLSALLSAFPEYSHEGTPFPVPTSFGVFPHTLCLGNPEARKFILDLLDEVAYLFKAKHIHLGFDEIDESGMAHCPKCQAEMKRQGLKKEKELIRSFQKGLIDHFFLRGVIPLIYNDGLQEKDHHVLSEVWQTVNPALRARAIRQINAGQQAIVAPFFSSYVSHPYSLVPLRKAFRYTPYIRGIKAKANVQGGEICYWSEYGAGEEKFLFEFGLRSALIARTLWGDKKKPFAKTVRDLQGKYSYYFQANPPQNLRILNPSFFARIGHFLAYTRDSDWEFNHH